MLSLRDRPHGTRIASIRAQFLSDLPFVHTNVAGWVPESRPFLIQAPEWIHFDTPADLCSCERPIHTYSDTMTSLPHVNAPRPASQPQPKPLTLLRHFITVSVSLSFSLLVVMKTLQYTTAKLSMLAWSWLVHTKDGLPGSLHASRFSAQVKMSAGSHKQPPTKSALWSVGLQSLLLVPSFWFLPPKS